MLNLPAKKFNKSHKNPLTDVHAYAKFIIIVKN